MVSTSHVRRISRRNVANLARRRVTLLAACMALGLVACSDRPAPAVVVAKAIPVSGERLAYLVGCVNCHHQTPKEILNAPPLVIVKSYSLEEFRTLMKTGVTRDGRDMYAQGSIMGIVAREQLSYLTDEELVAVHHFLQNDWTAQRGVDEEAKIATFPPPTFMKN